MASGEAASTAKAKYLQIADDIAAQIRSGALAPGAAVPSETELMARYGVASGTVRKAIAELRTMQLIETHHGRGSYVRSRPPVQRKSSDRFRRAHRLAGKAAYLAETEQAGGKPSITVLFVGPTEAPSEIAERLSIPAGTQVLARKRRYFRDLVPTEEATSYMPWDVVKDIPEMFAENPGPGGIYARLEERGYVLAEFTETVRARLATKAESSALALSPGSPVIHLVRDAITSEGRVVEVCDTTMAADQFVLDYRFAARD
ncbi:MULTISPECIES: GntR family transcriptional regulator [unclassified Kitasatospora]|uniref:GntR family transcriptional regulator n=1 Tax=unclassified Kitasatospora TaxID=2633591 RepID=UPI00070B339B|nr:MULTISPECIES: GntR family transcriptional regulator [unclassified Kitasatospora]KQV15333.1 GntR family transcriptional regulator [Kitasatospora sp. Root107]KRB64079.1 GntR family transcriptional regulator [Kitasatospora sp. Root187]